MYTVAGKAMLPLTQNCQVADGLTCRLVQKLLHFFLNKGRMTLFTFLAVSLGWQAACRAVDDLMQKSCDVLLFVMRNCMENSVVVKTWMAESFQVSLIPRQDDTSILRLI